MHLVFLIQNYQLLTFYMDDQGYMAIFYYDLHLQEKNAVNKFIEAILKEYHCCKKVIKKHFNKTLVMSAED